MRALIVGFALVCVALLLTTDRNFAQDKKEKEVVLKGLVCCAKCELMIAKKCETLIVVKDEKAKKDILYYFDKGAHKKYHAGICQTPKKGTVEGTVKVEDKKNIITVKKVTYD